MIAEQKSSIEIVRDHLDQPELLVQLAEEATELAQAALKLRRAYTGVNPTPITAKDAYQGLLEEIADPALLRHPFSRALWHALPEHGMRLEVDRGLAQEARPQVGKEEPC